MLKKVMAGLATVAIALGMVAVTATAAQAHQTVIDASVTCTTDFQYKIDWSIRNDHGTDEKIVETSNAGVIAVGTVIPANQTVQGSQVVASPQNVTLTVKATWPSDNFTRTDSKEIKANRFPPCQPKDGKVWICHATPPATAANGWNPIEVSANGSVGGHSGDAMDIIPAFEYWEKVGGTWTPQTYPGKNLGTVFAGFTGAQLLAADCAPKVIVTEPTFIPADCAAPGVQGQGAYTIPTQAGVTYSVRLNGGSWTVATTGASVPVGTKIDIKAEKTVPWVTLQGTKNWPYTVPSPGDCIVTTTPVAPTANPIAGCGVYGSITMPATTGVVYTLISGDGKQGPYTVRATPAAGYKFTGPQVVDFTGNLGTFTTCATPEQPKVTPITECGTYGSVTFKTTTGVLYELISGDGKQGAYTVRATPLPGYSFVGAQEVFFQGDLGKFTTCATAGPVEFDKSECEAGVASQATYFVPAKDGVEYTVSVDGGAFEDVEPGTHNAVNGTAVVVKASALPGYTITGTDEWEYAFPIPDCTQTATPVAPTVTDITECGEYGSIVLPNTSGVIYELTSGDGKEGQYVVTATPAKGWKFDGPQVVLYEGDLGEYTACATAGPVTFSDSECIANDPTQATYFITEEEGVRYEQSVNGAAFVDVTPGSYNAANGSTVVVKAFALDGYTLQGKTEWEHEFAFPFCPPVLASYEVSLGSASQVCDAGTLKSGSVTVSVVAGPVENPVPAVFILGKGTADEKVIAGTTQLPPGNYTVTAEPKLAEDSVYSTTGSAVGDGSWAWSFTIAPTGSLDCLQLTTLAFTGTSAGLGVLSIAGGMLFLGGAFLIMRRRSERISD